MRYRYKGVRNIIHLLRGKVMWQKRNVDVREVCQLSGIQ